MSESCKTSISPRLRHASHLTLLRVQNFCNIEAIDNEVRRITVMRRRYLSDNPF